MTLRNFFVVVVIIFFALPSCSSNSAKSKPAKSDSTGYVAPEPGEIPPAVSARYKNEIQNFYDNKLLRTGFNGAILVAKKGKVIFEDYHGYFNVQKKDSVLDKHSAFHIASVSKTFTAMATLKLAEMGKLSIYDDVKKFFPKFPYDNVTVKDLLSHRSGLPNYLYFMDKLGWDTKKHCDNEDVLDYLIKYKPAATRPNTHFTYCNTNYDLLGLIIEKASGESYADFLQQQFFTPLHMNDTYVWNIKDSASAMPSFDFRGRQEAFTFLDCGFGDKNIYSTPEDLLKWDQALYTNEIFSKKTLEEAFSPYSNEKPGIRNYGYGWRMNVYPDGRKVIYHNGWWHGNNAVFIRMIQDSVTIIVLGNKYNRNIYLAKDMEKIFNSESVPSANEDENAEIPQEELITKPFTPKPNVDSQPVPKKPVRKHPASTRKKRSR
ncbi:class A beta-lactamase-related serine hydrolase [Hanamia caeni]|jgi:CubicO group peptidase (beta-lactamase class C family)|uniref:Class A beta-lactamase-related serine hydrolase n=1 Tax=Hanamia caeni TaxID=2294116 RepID=A0A3M9N9F5_9BACT|nr:serine hydrolase domain-containing protein [Hanamia caeni]RNI33588.1 class A beta-lactamase-related serine hydrolase [Hanamia caeni]